MPSLSRTASPTAYPSASSYPNTKSSSGRSMEGLMIHLNPVRVSAKWTPWWSAIAASKRDETTVVATIRSGPCRAASRCSASRQPISFPVSTRQPESAGTATARRSASGSLAITRSLPVSAANASARSRTPGLLGVRERGGREVGIGVSLLIHDRRCRKPGRGKGGQQDVAAHAVNGGVDGTQVPRRVAPDGSDRRGHIPVDQLVAGDRDQRIVRRCQVGLLYEADLVDPSRDLRIDGRDDLRSVTPVDLEPVVGSGVVAGCDHHTRMGPARCRTAKASTGVGSGRSSRWQLSP